MKALLDADILIHKKFDAKKKQGNYHYIVSKRADRLVSPL
jgi:hypothetical protein